MDIQKYLEQNHPKVVEEYIRFTTPSYYEPNILYHPITNGMGCGFEGSNEPFEIINATYLKNGEMNINLRSTKKDTKIQIRKSEIHTKLKKIDESVVSKGIPIPNDKYVTYMTINGVGYVIIQSYWRDYSKKTLCGRVFVKCSDIDGDKQPYFELYCHFGSTFNMKHVYSYDSAGRENYNFNKNISVRKFKELVFGNPNVKFKCELFGHL